jgi:hypothetical protein
MKGVALNTSNPLYGNAAEKHTIVMQGDPIRRLNPVSA